MVSGVFFEFDASRHAVLVLLGNHLVLPLATVEVAKARCFILASCARIVTFGLL